MAVQVTCSDPGARHVYWNSTAPDEIIEDFLEAMGVSADGSETNASVVINYSTAPTYLYDVPPHDKYRTPVPDSLYDTDLDYQQGWCVPLEDPSATEFGQYYGRLLAHLTEGGHSDQYGRLVPSNYRYNISHYECLNELGERPPRRGAAATHASPPHAPYPPVPPRRAPHERTNLHAAL